VARQPEGPPPPPTVQRLRIRYTKRGRLRFTSHRDIARAFERALQRARVPMAYSAGFSPHPKVSWLGAAPTGVASEAEYVEIGLARRADLDELSAALDAALPSGIDILEVVEAVHGGLAERIEASHWSIELPDVPADILRAALAAFLATPEVPVERLTKNGRKQLDARGPVVRAEVIENRGSEPFAAESDDPCAILDLVVRHVTPAVRPEDVLTGLRVVADLVPPKPSRATRLAQGMLTAEGSLVDPLAADRDRPVTGAPSS
jgi:radical SAM-linked protein